MWVGVCVFVGGWSFRVPPESLLAVKLFPSFRKARVSGSMHGTSRTGVPCSLAAFPALPPSGFGRLIRSWGRLSRVWQRTLLSTVVVNLLQSHGPRTKVKHDRWRSGDAAVVAAWPAQTLQTWRTMLDDISLSFFFLFFFFPPSSPRRPMIPPRVGWCMKRAEMDWGQI